jgi:membrane protein YqaA with SNARE-associated domain
MTLTTSAAFLARYATAAASQAAPPHQRALLNLLFSFGLFGLFLVSIIGSSFVPIPIPGLTDIMIVIFAAQSHDWFLIVLLTTAGSTLGGYINYQVGKSGGMAFIKKRTSPRIFKLISDWMGKHAILFIALPAILPPPMPLSPFTLAAGALNMSRKKFLITFTLSRTARHAFAAWLGIHYGGNVLHLWDRFSARWGTTLLIVFWAIILISCAIALWKLYQASRTVGVTPASLTNHLNT